MAFPGNSTLLDAFTGTNATQPPNSNWTLRGAASFNLEIQSNQATSHSSTAYGMDYWNPGTFGPDTSIFCTVNTIPTTNEQAILLNIRLQNPGDNSLVSGYQLAYTKVSGAANDSWVLGRIDNTVVTTLATGTGPDLAAGNLIGLEAIGTVLTAYISTNSGSSWTSLVTYDTTGDGTKYTTAGNVALGIKRNVTRIDDFSGGTVSVPPVNTVAPVVTGAPAERSTLSSTTGTWTSTGSPTYTYQWQRDNSGGGSYSNISSATSSTYSCVSADVYCNVRCVVTDTDNVGAVSANSNSAGIIQPLYSGTPTSGGFDICSAPFTGTYSVSSGPPNPASSNIRPRSRLGRQRIFVF